MLDLTKLAGQMPGISEHLAQEAIAARKRLELAQNYLDEAIARQPQLVT